MQFSDSLWIEGGTAADFDGEFLRALDADGHFFSLNAKSVQVTAVCAGLTSVEIDLASTLTKWLLHDPVMGQAGRPARPSKLHLRKLPEGTILEYSLHQQFAQVILPAGVAAARDPRGGFRLSSPQPFKFKLILPQPTANPPLAFVERPTELDESISLLGAAGRPAGLAEVPGGWLLAAESAAGQVTPASLAWLLEQALDAYPEVRPPAPTVATDDSLDALAAAVDHASDQLTGLSHLAVDRYLYDVHFGPRLLAACLPALALLADASKVKLSLLQSRLDRTQPTERWPARLRAERFAEPPVNTEFTSLDQLNLWSLFAARSIIATHLTKRQNEPRS